MPRINEDVVGWMRDTIVLQVQRALFKFGALTTTWSRIRILFVQLDQIVPMLSVVQWFHDGVIAQHLSNTLKGRFILT